MHFRLLSLELKNFFRNPQFGVNIFLKILMFIGFINLGLMFFAAAFGLFYFAKDALNENPLKVFCKFYIYYWAIDLVIRFFAQKLPTQNIKPFLTLNIKKKTLIIHTILKTLFHFFNWGFLLFLIPFGALNIINSDASALQMIAFIIGIYSISYFNNFLNILLNGKDVFFYSVIGLLVVLGALEYYQYISLTYYSEIVFYSLYEIPGIFLIPIILTLILGYIVYNYYKANFYLDKGLELSKSNGKTENMEFLNRYGIMGTFIKNDIRLLKRSKAAKGALFTSAIFLFYGFIITSVSIYQNDYMTLFSGIFVTGGFLIIFGQRVPAWDSQHYPLMMTMNVPYKQYLKAKWFFIVLVTAVSMILALIYAIKSWELYFTIFAAGLYNLGVNSYLTLISGVFNKVPIDLNSKLKNTNGNKMNFNIKVFLMLIPQMLLPMFVFTMVKSFLGITPAIIALGILGLIGFSLRNRIFNWIVKLYKSEKYKTLNAFKKGI